MSDESRIDPVEVADRQAGQPAVRILADIDELIDDSSASAGARWTLAETSRELDANLIHLPAGRCVATHTETDLDVLLVVVAGSGTIAARSVVNGNLVWLPRGSTREIGAGPDGLSYLTVHRRRPGLQIRPRPRP